MTEAQIKHMVDRFLAWRLPADFNPDGGISFKPTFNEHTAHPMKHEPVGTNLLDATQAEAMVRHMIEGLPAEGAPGDPEAFAAGYRVLDLLGGTADEAEEKPVDAGSRDGITIGLVDAIITLAHTLDERLKREAKRLKSRRDDDHAWHSEAVLAALSDLAGNKVLQRLMYPRDETAFAIIHRAAALLGDASRNHLTSPRDGAESPPSPSDSEAISAALSDDREETRS